MRLNRYRIPLLVGLFGFISLLALRVAAAGPLTDIPAGMASSLGISSDLAKMILSCAILFSAGLLIAMIGKKANIMVTIIILLSIEGVLTAVGWLTPWLLMLSAVLIAAMFAGTMRKALGS
jgi:hypothetical protein